MLFRSPINSDPSLEKIILEKRPENHDQEIRAKYQQVYKKYESLVNPNASLKLIQSLDELHPLLQTSYQVLKSANVDHYNRLDPRRASCDSIHVTKALLERSMKFMHTLFSYFEDQGFVIKKEKSVECMETIIIIHDVNIRIALYEKVKQVPWVRDPKLPSYYSSSKYSFIPSGKLSLQIERVHREHIQIQWVDSPDALIESKIKEIAEGVQLAALKGWIGHLEWKEVREKEAEEEKKQKEKEDLIKRVFSRSSG